MPAAVLEIEAVAGGGGLGRGDGNPAGVPVRHVLRRFQLPHAAGVLRAVRPEPLPDARQVVPVVDHHQHGLAVGCFDQVFQRVQLAVVDHADVVELIIDRAVGKLQELSAQRRGR